MGVARRSGLVAVLVAVGVALAAGASGASGSGVDQFHDVPATHAFHDEIGWLADVAVTAGFADGTFRPEQMVTRQAMAAYLHRFWAELGRDDAPSIPDPGFTDVPSSHPFYADIAWLADLGVTSGFPDGTFRPTAIVSRQTMAASLHRFWLELGHDDPSPLPDPAFSDVPPGHQFGDDIWWLADSGVTTGFPDGTFRPTNPVSRQSTAAFLYRFWFHEAAVFVVDSATDAADALPGDGTCATGGEVCSLRAAVSEANAAAGQVIIELEVDPVIGLPGVREEGNATGDLDVSADVALIGDGHTIDGVVLDRVLDVHDGRLRVWHTTLTGGRAPYWDPWEIEDPEDESPGHGGAVRSVTPLSLFDTTVAESHAEGEIADIDIGGSARGRGGAIYVVGHDVVVRGVTMAANSTSYKGLGGAVFVDDGDLRLMDSVVDGNVAGIGGGLRLLDATATIEDSVLTGNQARSWYNTQVGEVTSHSPGAGGAIAAEDSIFSVLDSQIVRNVAVGSDGGAVAISGPPSSGPSVEMSVFEGTTISGNLATTVEGDGGAGGAIWADRLYALERSTVVDNHGRWVLAGSVFGAQASIISSNGPNDEICQHGGLSLGFNIVSGTGCELDEPSDQQSTDPLVGALGSAAPDLVHPLFSNSPAVGAIPPGTPEVCEGPAGCDIGAAQGRILSLAAAPAAFTVTTGTDGADAQPGDGLCASGTGECTLRAALDEANAFPTADTVVLETDVTLSLAATSDPLASGDDLVVSDDLVIEGNGHIVDAAGLGRVIDHRAGTLDLRELTVTGGLVPPGIDGAGMRTGGGGTLRLDEVAVADNRAIGDILCCIGYRSPANGGGIFADTTSVVIERSLLTGNFVETAGDGHAFFGLDADLTVIDSTFSANTGLGPAGTSTLSLTGGTGTIDASTFVEPTRILGSADGLVALAVRGSILVSASEVCESEAFGSGGHNLVSDDSCGFAETGDQETVDPLLGPLADNGGPTGTHLPGPTSPAVGAVPNGTAGLCTGPRSDQRGVVRPQGIGCDIGAVERQASDP